MELDFHGKKLLEPQMLTAHHQPLHSSHPVEDAKLRGMKYPLLDLRPRKHTLFSGTYQFRRNKGVSTRGSKRT